MKQSLIMNSLSELLLRYQYRYGTTIKIQPFARVPYRVVCLNIGISYRVVGGLAS
jgi:hypothetical protein